MSDSKKMKLDQDSGTTSLALAEPCATMKDLPSEILKKIFTFIGKGHYLPICQVSKDFCYNYLTMDIVKDGNTHSLDHFQAMQRNMITNTDSASSCLETSEYCFLDASTLFQRKVCNKAALKGRRDIVFMAKALGVRVDLKVYLNLSNSIMEKRDPKDIPFLRELYDEIHNQILHGRDLSIYGRFKFVVAAAYHGNLEILKWLHSNKGGLSSLAGNIFRALATGGHLDIIIWAKDCAKLSFDTQDCINGAVSSGNLDLIKWLRGEGAQWNYFTLFSAVRNGNIELLHYLFQSRCPFTDPIACAEAVTKKSLEVLQFLHQHGVTWTESTCMYAARDGNLEALHYARSNGCPWNSSSLEEAAKYGHYDVVKYCLENGCPFSDDVCRNCMEYSNHDQALRILKLLRSFSVPLDAKTCETAVENGNLEAVKYARSQGGSWDANTSWKAILTNDVLIIQYCFENNCPYYNEVIYETAMCCKDPISIFKLLQNLGCEWGTIACNIAAAKGKLNVLRWLRYNGCPWDEGVCNEAVRANHYEILKYAHENGCTWTRETYSYCFHKDGLRGDFEQIPTEHTCSDEIFRYLREHNCPRPNPEDWQITASTRSEYDSDSDEDDDDWNSE
ncbi:hypothetical protein CTEN210_09826 [Chaetoceros tenuissimus]|uniref:F-box domain-containing protein n=1 Tax=Chaetoceros tenuissimus TaxID=426638 RepID=A0AAD3CYP6_9STRA|nr:hypothetical protein CTEN210_09826 [Chaetoceros tenuissimus]